MADTLKLEIVTPDANVYSEDVQMVTLPARGGQIGILPAPRAAADAGRARRNHRAQGRAATVSSPSAKGSWKSPANASSIVTDMAVPAENIDEAKAEEARQRAAARLRDKISDEEVATGERVAGAIAGPAQVKRRRRV